MFRLIVCALLPFTVFFRSCSGGEGLHEEFYTSGFPLPFWQVGNSYGYSWQPLIDNTDLLWRLGINAAVAVILLAILAFWGRQQWSLALLAALGTNILLFSWQTEFFCFPLSLLWPFLMKIPSDLLQSLTRAPDWDLPQRIWFGVTTALWLLVMLGLPRVFRNRFSRARKSSTTVASRVLPRQDNRKFWFPLEVVAGALLIAVPAYLIFATHSARMADWSVFHTWSSEMPPELTNVNFVLFDDNHYSGAIDSGGNLYVGTKEGIASYIGQPLSVSDFLEQESAPDKECHTAFGHNYKWCFSFYDDYQWLVDESPSGSGALPYRVQGNEVEVVLGKQSAYYHVLGTRLITRRPLESDWRYLDDSPKPTLKLAFGTDGSWWAVKMISGQYDILHYDGQTWTPIEFGIPIDEIPRIKDVPAIAVDRENRLWVMVSDFNAGDGHRRIFRVNGGQWLEFPLPFHWRMETIAFDDSDHLWMASKNDFVRYNRRMDSGLNSLAATSVERPTKVLGGAQVPIAGIAFLPDNETVVVGSADGALGLWDATTDNGVRVFDRYGGRLSSLALSQDGGLLAAGGQQGLAVWDVPSGTLLYDEPTGRIESVAFSQRGDVLAAGDWYGSLSLRDSRTGANVRKIPMASSSIQSIAFSPDDKLIGLLSLEHNVKIWDTTTGKVTRTLPANAVKDASLAFSPDGRLLAAPDTGTAIQLWDVSSGRSARKLTGHDSSVEAITFSVDGKLLASAGGYEVKIWDVATGHESRTLKGHVTPVNNVAFSRDGKLLVSSDLDGNTMLWNLQALGIEGTAQKR